MRILVFSFLLPCVVVFSQAPAARPLGTDLRHLDDRFHLLDRGTSLQEDLSSLLKENGFQTSSTVAAPRLILMPSVSAIQGGYAYGVISYLQRPGEPGGLRSSAATAVRARKDILPGLRQALVDTATGLLLKLKDSDGGPLRTLSIPGAPNQGSDYTYIPIQDLRTRIQPERPRLTSFARSQRIHGLVKVSIIIGPDGYPQKSDFLSGPPELAFTALAYTFQCVYVPDKEGRTIRTELVIPFGNLSPSDTDMPGLGVQRTRVAPEESMSAGSFTPEP